MTIVEFLTARLDEREAIALAADPGPWEWVETGPPMSTQALVSHVGNGLMVVPSRTPDVYPSVANARFMEDNHPAAVLAVIAAHRAIIELHKQWPILVEGPTKFDQSDASGLDSVAFKMSRQIAWMTEQEYRNRFGDEPPTAPMMRALASLYADHRDYQQEWALRSSVRSSSTS